MHFYLFVLPIVPPSQLPSHTDTHKHTPNLIPYAPFLLLDLLCPPLFIFFLLLLTLCILIPSISYTLPTSTSPCSVPFLFILGPHMTMLKTCIWFPAQGSHHIVCKRTNLSLPHARLRSYPLYCCSSPPFCSWHPLCPNFFHYLSFKPI